MEYRIDTINDLLGQLTVDYVGVRYGSVMYFLFGKIKKIPNKHVMEGEIELDILSDNWSFHSTDFSVRLTSIDVTRSYVETSVLTQLRGNRAKLSWRKSGVNIEFSNGFRVIVDASYDIDEAALLAIVLPDRHILELYQKEIVEVGKL